MFFDQTIKNISRAREIVKVMVKYGFEDLVVNTSLYRLLPEQRRLNWLRDDRPIVDFSSWERIRMAMEELGPTFIKGAQVLSNRADLIPPGLIQEFQKLQSDVPPFSSEEARAIVSRELGRDLDTVFEYFNDKPIGAASIGQVHRAQLKDGTEVVIKVQRPNIRETVETDMSILKEIITRSEDLLDRNGITNVMTLLEAFEKTMMQELDYRVEAKSIEQFREFYKSYTNFYIPRVYRNISTERIMVMEFVRGCKITDVEQLQKWGIDPAKIAEEGMHIYLTQIFEYGYFHADPHPGNILVRRDGVICLLDFGMVGKLNRRDKFAFAGVLVGIAQKNHAMAASSLRRLAVEDDIKDYGVFEYELGAVVEEFSSQSVSESNMAESGQRLQKIIYDNKMKVPGSVFLILRAMAILEGIGKEIHPNFVVYDFVAPYGVMLAKQQLAPEYLGSEAFRIGSEMWSFASGFPLEVKDILRKTRRGTLKFDIEHKGYEPGVNQISNTLQRFALIILSAAMMLSAAILATADPAGKMHYLAWTLMIAGGLVGAITFFAILRNFRT
jgi:ubiquinone biosynthesis protein